MKRVLAALIFMTLIMISGCEEDFATSNTGGKVDTLYIGTKDTVYKVDTIKTITVIEEIDTIIKVTIDSIIKVDTITTLTYDTLHVVDTLFIDTGYHIDTLYITDTTKYNNDTIYSGKTVFAMGLTFLTATSYELSIKSSSFKGEIPTLVEPAGEFGLNSEGALSFVDTFSYSSTSSNLPYTILAGSDTLTGTIQLNNYIVDSIVLNDTTFYRPNHFGTTPLEDDSVWRIAYNFPDSAVTLSWDNDSLVKRSFIGTNDHQPDWLSYRVYSLTGETEDTTEENSVSFDMSDPIIEKISAEITSQTGSIHGMKPHASSPTMESYLIAHESVSKIEIYKPREWMDGLYYIGPGGWTEFEDPGTKPLSISMYNTGDTLHNVTIEKNGNGYAIAHGRVGHEDYTTTMRKLKQIYINYSVGDENDTVSLGLTAGIKTATDEVTWSTFRAVVTSALPYGRTETAILDLSDFYISWDDKNFPVGTTLADVIADDYRETINSITIAPENPDDDTFEMTINTLYFAGDYGFIDEAVMD